MPTRTDIVENDAEFAAIGHLRGWCHNGDICPICEAYRRGQADAIRKIAEG